MTDADFTGSENDSADATRRDAVPPELYEQIRSIHDVLGPYLNVARDEFESGFVAGESLAEEVDLWLRVTAAWIAYHEEHLNDEPLSAPEEQRLISALIAIASGVSDASKLGVPRDTGEMLLECYHAGNDDEDE